jgi:glutaminyl-tRNA synthetase
VYLILLLFLLLQRRILKLVSERTVRGWDDPRILTINGLRRRGYTPEAINAFCRDVGITRNDNLVGMHRLEHHCREHLDAVAKRVFAVLRPLRVTLVNVPEDYCVKIDAPDFPRCVGTLALVRHSG